MKVLKLFLLFLFFGGCAVASGPDFNPVPERSDGSSNIVFYRPFVEFKKLTRPKVFIDGEDIGGLSTGGVLTAIVQPGTHNLVIGATKLSWEFDNIEFEFSAESNKNHYFELGVRRSISVNKMIAEIEEVPEFVALQRLRGLKHINPDK